VHLCVHIHACVCVCVLYVTLVTAFLKQKGIKEALGHQYSVVDKALSTMKANKVLMAYEMPTSINSSTMENDPSSASPNKIAVSLKTEQNIYETPLEDEENYGPIYQKPPSDEGKIYEEFEGKKLRKLFHNEIM